MPGPKRVSLGEAARMIGVSADTLRRWDRDGKLKTTRDERNRRLVSLSEVRRLGGKPERHLAGDQLSARNRFPGIVTRVIKDEVAAQVEIQAGPHRVVSLITREAADELDLAPGDLAIASVKSTSVVVEVPGPR